MKSKRDLKKQIRYICGDLVGECLLLSEVSPEDKDGEVAQLIVDIAVLQETAIARCSFSFDKAQRDFPNHADYRKARSAYYRAAFSALHDDFNHQLRDILHRMNELAGKAK